jgi:hypothetical protein
MTFVCPDGESAADSHRSKSQRLLNTVLRTTGKFSNSTPDRELHVTFRVACIYDYVTKLRRQKAEVIHFHKMQMFATSEKAIPDTKNIRGLCLGAVKSTSVQVTKLPL